MGLRFSKQALKFLKKQPLAVSERIVQSIKQLPEGDVKKLKGTQFYRLRIGSYRVIFDKESETLLLITKIENRGQIYKH